MLILLMLAELAAEPPVKASVHKSTLNMARCVQAQIGQLDDGLSDARTIAQGASSACADERATLRRAWVRAIDDAAKKAARKDGEMPSDEVKAAQLDRTMSELEDSLLENAVRWVLQKRAMTPADSAAGKTEGASAAR
jgi:hypothetical protein